MRERRDLTGLKFNRWTVISKEEDSINGDGMWLCQCKCGNFSIVTYGNLVQNKSKSCGCLSIENRKEMNSRRVIDLTNRKFGKLTALKLEGSRNNASCWLCECECGNFKIVRASHLQDGSTYSCGCLRQSKIASELKKYYIKEYGAVEEYRILKNPKTGYPLPFDIYFEIQNSKFFIEVNGVQHYSMAGAWGIKKEKFEYNKSLDRIKRKYARKNGIYIEIDLRKIKTVKKAIIKIDKIIQETITHAI